MAATVQGVAARIARLTPDHDGYRLGQFTEDTSPSQGEVQGLLEDSIARIAARFGTVDTELEPARDAAAEAVAALTVALSWDLTDDTYIDRLRQLAQDAITDLAAGFSRLHPGTDPANGSSDQPITGYVGVPGTVRWRMPPGPYEPGILAPLAQRPYGWRGLPPMFDGRV